ncbi:ATP-binding protein [Streptomyces sp. NPDC059786]|uniref:ATP-binding protein n=1 Tax=Streptomyces sp. NPDC059786 TaxID=3346946 RepID=UPI00365D92E9
MTLRAVLPAYGLTELLDTAELLASELTTNAYRHTRGPAALRLKVLGDAGPPGVRVSVWDTDPYIPEFFGKPPGRGGLPHTEADGGRGLHLVRRCADRWGGFRLGDGSGWGGKLLWCELGSPRGGAAATGGADC